MTDDLLRYGTSGGAYAGNPEQIASLFKEGDVRLVTDGPWEITYLGDRKERWPSALEYISHYVELFRQWAYRRADGETVLLQEIDGYIRNLYEWVKEGRTNGRLDEVELERLRRVKEALTERLHEYVPERLISEGQAGIERLLVDIENTEHVEKYPADPSPKWYDAEMVRLGLLAERVKLVIRLVDKVHPESADKYRYLHYLDQVVGDIAYYTGVLKCSRDEYARTGPGEIRLEEHLAKIDGDIEDARARIDNHLADLRSRLSTTMTDEQDDEDDKTPTGTAKPRGKKGGRKPKYDARFWKLVQKTYDDLRDKGMDSKGAWNKAADTHGLGSGDAARMQCLRYLHQRRNSEQN